jgi:hypothetical protein
MATRYNLFIINSHIGLKTLFDFLISHSKSKLDVIGIRKDYTRNSVTRVYKESPRRFALLKEDLYNKLVLLGYGEGNEKDEDIEIIPYEILPEDYARRNASNMHFYFPLNNKTDNCLEMSKKLKCLEEFGLLNKNDWRIYPQGICEFKNSVRNETRIIIKIILDNPSIFRVSWCRLKMYNDVVRK